MGVPRNDPGVHKLAANGLNGHLADVFGPPPKPAKQAPLPGRAKIGVMVRLPGVVVRSEANIGGRLPARLGRKAAVKKAVGDALALVPVFGWRLPARVRLLRIGARLLDSHDNLRMAFKPVADVVARWLAVDDGDGAKVTWRYAQRKVRKGEAAGIRITVGEI